MSKTILVCGFGPGISSAVAERFGREGFSAGLVARSAARLEEGVKVLSAKGIKVAALPTDLADPAAAAGLVERVHKALGPVTVIHWNAYGSSAGDLLAADAAAVRTALDIAVVSPLALLRAALSDLRQSPESAVLLTNGGLFMSDPQVDAMGVQWGAMGLSVANAAKHKLTGLLAEKLKGDKVYVGEVAVLGTVKGTAFDTGGATLEASTIAEKFWALYKARKDVFAQVG